MGNSFAEILIKPVSMRCNLACDYCFYIDESNHRNEKDKGIMSIETATFLVKRALEIPRDTICFTFQGGEPTLAGLEFFQYFIKEVNRQNASKKEILYSMQTNGTTIDDAFAKFLKDNNFLVGISLDGPRAIHDKHRGTGSYDKVLNCISIFKKAGIVPNVLCVVTNDSCAYDCYTLYKDLGLSIQQYIPCLDKIDDNNSNLTPSHFGTFLCELYDLWIDDLKAGNNISIRYFENLALLLGNEEAESCNFLGGCKLQFVTESNGDVYPCDFYCLDDYKLGNIQSESYLDMANTNIAKSFAKKKSPTDYDEKCKACNYFKLCRAGCKREYQKEHHTQFCESYLKLFEHIKNASN